jgi:hypothetical protein
VTGVTFLFIGGLITLGYWNMSTALPASEMNNVGLMNDRIVGVTIGIGLGIMGAILTAVHWPNTG